MKKILLTLFLIVPVVCFSQSGQTPLGNFYKIRLGNSLYTTQGDKLIYPSDSANQYHYDSMRDPSEPLDGVNLRTLFRRIAQLDSLGILVTNIISGNETVNTGTTNIPFETPFDSTDVTVVTYVRRISDDAVIDYRLSDVDQNGFNVTVWEDNIKVSYVASQKNPESNNFFETILHQSDTATIFIDTSQVRNLQTFV